jgi:type I restriction enzyme S subunit
MQKIFSRELRFKIENERGELVEPPEWENKRLGEVAIKQSSNISANTIEDNEGEYKIYGAAGLLKKIDFYREEQAFISIVKDGAGVGRTLLCEAFSSVLGTLDILKPNTNSNLNFLYYLINSIEFTKYVTGSTIPHIYFRDYSKEKIKIPRIEEQTKIANFLSAIDEKIATVAEALEATEQFKKGLLQQLFV